VKLTWRAARNAGDRDRTPEPEVPVLVEDLPDDGSGEKDPEMERRRPPRRRRPLRARSTGTGAVEDGSADEEPGDEAPVRTDTPPAAAKREGRGAKWIRGLVPEPNTDSRAEAEHEAALALRQSMTPAMQQLLLNVPGSSTPEEAGASLAEQAALHSSEAVPIVVLDLSHPPEMAAYRSRETLSNRVLRLTSGRSAKREHRSWNETVSEKCAIAEQERAQRPAGTGRCQPGEGLKRCPGVFVYHADDQDDGSLLYCPKCGQAHHWSASNESWVAHTTAPALAEGAGASD
jgi:hypothetical protein